MSALCTIAEAKVDEHSLRTLGIHDRAAHARICKAKNFFKKLAKYKRTQWANEMLEEASGHDIFGFRDWSKGTRNYPSPAIDRGPGIPRATTHAEKCAALRGELYQTPPHLPNSPPLDLNLATDDEIPFADVTRAEVEEALFSASSASAPGESEATYKIVKWAWAAASEYIVGLAWHEVKGGHHANVFKRAIAIALRKLGKKDYSKPRAYRLITLLECLGKVIEKVVARRLAYYAGKFGLVPPEQFGGCANTSTTDAVLTFTHDVHAAWNSGRAVSALTFDIKGYFDFVNHNRLLRVLRDQRIPLPIVRWVRSFLTGRQAAVCLDGQVGEMAP